MITLQAKNSIITDTGSHKPGEVFKCDPETAAFLLKKGAAVEIKKTEEKKTPDSPAKEKVIKTAVVEKTKAEKKASKKKKAAERKAAQK